MAGDFCGVAGTPAASKGWGCVKMNICICVYIVLIELWTRSPNKEVENWKIRSVFKYFRRFFKFGKVRKTEETLTNFPEKSKRLKKKRKEKKIATSLPHYFLKIC